MALAVTVVCPEVSADAQLGSYSDRRRGAMLLVLRQFVRCARHYLCPDSDWWPPAIEEWLWRTRTTRCRRSLSATGRWQQELAQASVTSIGATDGTSCLRRKATVA